MMMFFSTQNKDALPPAPVPAFILTDSSSTINKCDTSSAGNTPLTLSLDERLKDLQTSSGECSPEVAQTLSALGGACLKNGDYQEALRYYTQALDVKKELLGSHHPEVADTLASIGYTSMKLSMPSQSTSNFNAALAIYMNASTDRTWVTEKDGSTKQVDYDIQRRIASTRAALGASEFEQKHFEAAKKHFEDALLDAKRSAVTAVSLDRAKPPEEKARLSEARIYVSEMFNNIASVSAEQGDKEAAIGNYNSALALQIQVVGEDNPSVASTLHNIGTMHHRSGEFQFALKSYKQVLKMHRFLYGTEDLTIVDCLLNIATVHERADEMERCISAMSAAKRICAKHHGIDSVECADITLRLAALYGRNKCDELALANFDVALAVYRNAEYDDSHPSVEMCNNAIHYLKNRGDESREDEDTGIDAWSDMFNKGCGSICFTNDTNVTQGMSTNSMKEASALVLSV